MAASGQRFTALGTISGVEPYQVEMSADLKPWRLAVDFEETGQADVRPLLEDLDFIPDRQRWGMPFRRGLFEVSGADFAVIAAAMRAVSRRAAPRPA